MSQNPQTPESPLTDIFISYRRGDTKPEARQLETQLEKYFPGRVFRDMHDIDDGTDYRDVINEKVGECGALLVLIGKQWLTLEGKDGKRRLDDPGDLVVAEVAGALKRTNVRVIPVLLQEAEMPSEDNLPESLKPLAYKNARKIDEDHWDEDVAKLAAQLEKVCGASPRPAVQELKPLVSSPAVAPPGKSGMKKIVIAAVAGALVVVALVVLLASLDDSPQPQPQQLTARLENPQPSNAPTSDAPKSPSDAPKWAARRAVVNLARNEAEFFFPFNTEGDKWTWFRKASKVDAQEYHWDVFVPGDYKITVFLQKAKGDAPGKGDFKSLLGYTDKGVKWRNPGAEFGEIDEKFPLEITPTPEPDGLRVVVKGAGVERMFAQQRPKEIALMIVTPDEEAESELTTTVEYK
jgi:uncharacterized protein (DUF1330 family)